MNYELPTVIEISGTERPIRNRGDWRVMLDVMDALNDPDMIDRERIAAALYIFYENGIPADIRAAMEGMMWFLSGGDRPAEAKKDLPPLMDWEQDFPIIIAPINRVLGRDVRAEAYMHWWTFLSAYMEIGESTFSTVLSIRQKQAKGKKLEKWESDFLREHSDLVRLRKRLSQKDQAFLDSFLDE